MTRKLMFVELRILPLGSISHLREAMIGVLEQVEASGLAYQLTPAGISINGASQEVIPLIQQCYDYLHQKSVLAIAMFENDEQENQSAQTSHHLATVKERLERTLKQVDA